MILPLLASAQVLPKEGSELNYRLVVFTFPDSVKATGYALEVACGRIEGEADFRSKLVKGRKTGGKRELMWLLPYWDTLYTWQVTYLNKQGGSLKSPFYHFRVAGSPMVDTNQVHLRILKSLEKYSYEGAFVLPDNSQVLYDMKGNPVWFLPEKKDRSTVRSNMEFTPFGTLTLLDGSRACEINCNGDILWEAPNDGKVSGDSIENYHHDFTRLANGHYMVLGNEPVEIKHEGDTIRENKKPGIQASSTKIMFGTVMEYDEKGKLIWYWKSSDYYFQSDLIYYHPQDLFPNRIMELHANAFCFDEKNKAVYVGFRNVSRIVKLKYPEGTVLNTYGEVFKPGVKARSDVFFCGQHGITHAGDGHLFVFDNNSCSMDKRSKVVELSEPEPGAAGLKKVWEYVCDVGNAVPKGLYRGGNVTELQDNDLFVCTGSPYGRLFIVNKDKKLLWSAVPEKWSERAQKWELTGQYRACIVTDKERLQQFIKDGENSK